MGKLYFVGFLFSWFKWTTKSAKIRTPRLIMISQYFVINSKFINSICLFINFSYDGVPFVFHDHTFRRTTNIASVFPEDVDSSVSSFNISKIRQLNAGSWFLEVSHRVI